MNRKNFLKNAGYSLIAGPFVIQAWTKQQIADFVKNLERPTYNCIAQQSATAGPFYQDPELLRSNIAENLAGLPLQIQLQIISAKDCKPIPNAAVSIWHCAPNGSYSKFGKVFNNPFDASKAAWLRGYQVTDAEGCVVFDSIFPGWYPGRAHHIHVDVHLDFQKPTKIDRKPNESSTFITQLYFPTALTEKIHSEIEPYKQFGINPKNTSNDYIAGKTKGAEELTVWVNESDFPERLSCDFRIGIP